MRLLFVLAGLLSVGVGFIGLITPLPGTVFFIIAAWFFSKSSPRLERWVLDLPGVGKMVEDYRNGLGMPKRAKITAISCIVLACTFSVGFAVDPAWARIAIALTGVVGVWYVGWHVPTTETVLAEREAELAA